jgi:hypothetical protein
MTLPDTPVRGLALRSAARIGLGTAGAVTTLVAIAGPISVAGVRFGGTAGPVRAMLGASVLALVMLVVLVPEPLDRLELLTSGLCFLGGLSVVAMAASALLVAILLLPLAAVLAARGGGRTFPERMRGPAVGVFLMGVGGVLVTAHDVYARGRLGVLGVVLGLLAMTGLVPFLRRIDPREPASVSGLAWPAFVAPTLAMVVLADIVPTLSAAQGVVYAILCIAFGLLNLWWGVLAAWRAPDALSAWRHSFIADWGMALTGMGVVLPDGIGVDTAYLVLLSVLLVRLPLYVLARRAVTAGEPPANGPLNLLVGFALAGVAPFAGFAARVYLVRATTELSWPLAWFVVGALVLWLLHGFRLGRSLGRPTGRAAVGVAVVLAISLPLGTVPWLVLRAGGL